MANSQKMLRLDEDIHEWLMRGREYTYPDCPTKYMNRELRAVMERERGR